LREHSKKLFSGGVSKIYGWRYLDELRCSKLSKVQEASSLGRRLVVFSVWEVDRRSAGEKRLLEVHVALGGFSERTVSLQTGCIHKFDFVAACEENVELLTFHQCLWHCRRRAC